MSPSLRRFLYLFCFYCLVVSALPYAGAQSTRPVEAGESRYHMIGCSHIDAVWLWPWSETVSVVLGTFRSALDRMNETPGFIFTESSAQFYEWVAEADPKLLAEIRQRIEEGRWEITGGWWVEPDVNIPNGEALARQGLYGQRLFKELFGRTARVGYNTDSFGHAGTLPQILKLQGMNNYVFMRPDPREKTLPADLFWWEAPDGTRVLAYRGTGRQQIPSHIYMGFYGAGDHGGGPTKQNIQSILDMQKRPGAGAWLFSSPERYFAEIRNRKVDLDLPVVHDELQWHSVGCYTAESEIKKDNRATETLLVTGEKMAALASAVADYPYPRHDFDAAWKKLLFLQFHDILAGTSLPEEYVAARDGHGYAMEVANHALYLGAERIAWQVPTVDPESEYLVVFNPHAWDTTLNVEHDFEWAPRRPGDKSEIHSVLEDDHGTPVVHQWAQASTVIGYPPTPEEPEVLNKRHKLVFRAAVPAFGYRQFRLRNLPGAAESTTALRASERELENEHLRVSFAEDGTISILDKDSGRQVFRTPGGARGVIVEDLSDTWSHGVRDYSKEIGAFGSAQFQVLERGPLRARVHARSTYGGSVLEVDWLLYAGSRTLEARVALDWHEQRKMLKFSFPVDVEQPTPTFEIAYGSIVRPTDGHEVPGQRWVDLSGRRPDGTYGLAIVNDAKYGYSVRDSDMRISIARGAVYAHHGPIELAPDGVYLWQDQGRQTFRLLLVPHSGTWQYAGVAHMTEEYVAPVPVIYQGIHPGRRPLSASFLSVDAPNVVVSALKKAEEGQDLILRCYETNGQPAKVTLDLTFLKRRWSGTFRPFEIKTLRVPLAGGPIREVNLLEE